jgi:hypothetical protein
MTTFKGKNDQLRESRMKIMILEEGLLA